LFCSGKWGSYNWFGFHYNSACVALDKDIVMKKKLILTLLMVINCCGFASTAEFTLCKSKFALCTRAACEAIPGKKGLVSCHCTVQKGYSVGKQACSALKKATKGKAIRSRYSPIKSYVLCTNRRPWAWCLDSPCQVDKKDPTKAACVCSLVEDKGNYIIVADRYSKKVCTKGIYSSATVKGSKEITDFLKGHKELPPLPVKVLKASRP
jgi:hypothetical protein